MRIIDADKLKEKVERRILNNPIYGKHFKEFIKVLMETVVDNEPTVDPVKHGKWISEKCNHKPYRIKNPEKWVIYKCSICGYSNGRKQSNYCPECGAKMDGEEE